MTDRTTGRASSPTPTRRTLLSAAAAAPLVACTWSPDADPGPPPPVDPDIALREAAVLRERTLLATYDAAVAAAPPRARLLRPLRAEHAEHLAVLGATSAGLDASTAPLRPAPGTGTLVAAEREASQAHAAAAVTASPALAQVLASLAACEASHEVALRP